MVLPGSFGINLIAKHFFKRLQFIAKTCRFKKIKFFTNENVGSGDLNLPTQEMHTTAWWLTVPREVMAALPFAADDRRDGVVGLSFALRQIAQLVLMCDRQDIGLSIDSAEEKGSGVVVWHTLGWMRSRGRPQGS